VRKIVVTIALSLSACGAPVSRPMPLAASGPVAITHDGASFIVDLQPVTGGAEMSVARDGAALGYDEGLLAKRVAEDFCAARGAKVDPAAFGRFASGQWLFDGGCA
jgi:hypothetical protein